MSPSGHDNQKDEVVVSFFIARRRNRKSECRRETAAAKLLPRYRWERSRNQGLTRELHEIGGK